MPDILATRWAGRFISKHASTIAAVTESWPQPAQSVEITPS